MDPGLAPGLTLLSDPTLEPLFPTFPTCGALYLPETHVKTNPSSLQLLLSDIFVTVTSKVTERTLLMRAVVTCHRGGMAASLLGDAGEPLATVAQPTANQKHGDEAEGWL